MSIKRKYLPILIGNLRRDGLEGVVFNHSDPDLDTPEDADEDIDGMAGVFNARDDASTVRRLH